MSASLLAVEPAHRSVPAYTRTLGPEVADLARLAGFGPDPEQELLLDAIFALDGRGGSAAFEIAAIACRQNLKTGLFKQAALGWLFITDQRLIVWSAHEFRTTQEAFRDLDTLITGSDVLRKRVKHIYRGNGDEAIELVDDRRLIFKARTKGGGRGLSGDKVILDEAFALQPMHMGALLPTLSARPDPQVLYGSSAGMAESDVLRALRDRGRAGGDPRLAYFEWCAPPPAQACTEGAACSHMLDAEGCGCDDPELWRRANPAIGRRITVEHIAAERRAMPPEEFGRERMGWWDDPLGVDERPIEPEDWADCALEVPERPAGTPSFFIDCSPGLSSASISAATTHDGRPRIELSDYRPGASWLEGEDGRVLELARTYPGARFAAFGSGAVSALLPGLAELGVEVEHLGNQDMGRACGHLQKLVMTRGLSHDGNPLYESALKSAVKRPLGDDLWTWSRRKSADISPIVSATGAAWLLETEPDYDVTLSVY